MSWQHSMSCEYPEGCGCGANEYNFLENQLKKANEQIGNLQQEIVALMKMQRKVLDECIEYRKKEVKEAFKRGMEAACKSLDECPEASAGEMAQTIRCGLK